MCGRRQENNSSSPQGEACQERSRKKQSLIQVHLEQPKINTETCQDCGRGSGLLKRSRLVQLPQRQLLKGWHDNCPSAIYSAIPVKRFGGPALAVTRMSPRMSLDTRILSSQYTFTNLRPDQRPRRFSAAPSAGN
jgi:hypothetical protein